MSSAFFELAEAMLKRTIRWTMFSKNFRSMNRVFFRTIIYCTTMDWKDERDPGI